ncbi:bifunctional UDP-N-acetylglucosamine diphosphorylase/glucosamine-1-phosphate N-acetyltransferase GlmU [bacterium AH-315-K03]|nr:bifunctional UDP-N-acetylglucosamine diphosphorylase/glucosamine-1-phosphate N-acetyltransferase GlmU [bacterium AH-315-K03]
MAVEVIILAAGQGTRMRSNLPKVLHPIAGKPMLTHVIDSSKQLGAKSIHVVIGHGAEQVQEQHCNDDIQWVIQKEQLGTGHAVAQALPSVSMNNIVLVVYGDVPLIKPETLKKLLLASGPTALSLLTVELPNPTGYGRIIRDQQNNITAIVEQKDATDSELGIREVNTGILAVPADKLSDWLPALSSENVQGEYYLTDIISMAVKDGIKIVSQQAETIWEVQGVNTREQLAELERYHQEQQAKVLMANGATLADPKRIDIRGKLNIGLDVTIDINCIFIGNVSIANNVTIGPNCIIENTTIDHGSVIKANSVLDGASVAKHCIVGPFARLRPGTELLEKARVGNFVELKNTHLGNASKVNHLAYVGDSEIGKDCNIGAGTITCNYDGVNKFKTTMGDKVFIGSNSTLVAPLNIAKDSFVGAGSTVTKDIPEKNLAIARGKQKNIEGWSRPTKKTKS